MAREVYGLIHVGGLNKLVILLVQNREQGKYSCIKQHSNLGGGTLDWDIAVERHDVRPTC